MIEDLLRMARAAGALEAEVYRKSAHGRRVILEPAPSPGRRVRITVSTSEEEGVALRLRDRKGRWGYAWSSPEDRERPRDLVHEALESARGADPERRTGLEDPTRKPATIPCAPPAAPDGEPSDLGIDDPDILAWPAERVSGILAEASDAAASSADRAASVDAVQLSEARTSVTLANSLGFSGSYEKTLALLSVSIVPEGPGAAPALEERSTCRLRDLAPRECGLEAARRSAPPRPAIPPPADDLPVVLEPRAAASLLSALVPWILAGDPGADAAEKRPPPRPGTEGSPGFCVIDDARLPGRFGSVPFDGVGRRTGRTTVVAAGRPTGLISAARGNVVRHSFREPPALGLTNLSLIPLPGIGSEPTQPFLRVAAARFQAGRIWAIRVRRGEWWSGGRGGGAPLGSADGILWEGPLGAILGGIAAAGPEIRFYHLGLPIGAASLIVEGLDRWRVVESPAPLISGKPPRSIRPLPVAPNNPTAS